MATIKDSNPLFSALQNTQGTIVARESRDTVVWLVVEFPGYGSVTLPASEFNEV